ncbi:ricin-type beta-trefoil lectin domain protein [Streptomyces sp. NPDC059070]|uniref:ricin-type beta-trefoil lectin domain protein n=1 Tax=unclassified Streptomyces TaxID=2593676 RepID=UPI0034E2DA17
MRRTAAALITALLAVFATVLLPANAQASSPGSCTTRYEGPYGSATCSGVDPSIQWRAVVGCFYLSGGQPVPFTVLGNVITGSGTSVGGCTGASWATKHISAEVVGVAGRQGRLVGYGGKCMDIASGKTTVATPVQIYDCNGTNAQWWTLGNDHSVRGLGMCLNVVWGTADSPNGTKVEIYDCVGSPGEQWIPQPDGSLKNVLTGKCLDDLGFATANRTQLGIWDCNGLANQKWTLTP